MRVERDAFFRATDGAGIERPRASAAWDALALAEPSARPPFTVATVAYYFGAMIVIGAMTFFMSVGLSISGEVTVALALAYAAAFVACGSWLHRRPQTRIPGGLLIAAAVSLTPLAVYGLERSMGLWTQGDPGAYGNFYDYVRGSWMPMEVATLITSALAIALFRVPFIATIVSFTLWYMSMDLAPLLFGTSVTWDERCWVSVAVGLATIALAFAVDRRTREDYAFWGYLFGATAFFCGLCLLEDSTEPARAGYAILCLFSIAVSVLIGRRVFLVFGALGIATYLGHLSWDVFNGEPIAFTFCLTAIGLGIIAAGIAYQQKEKAILAYVDTRLPAGLRAALPRSRV